MAATVDIDEALEYLLKDGHTADVLPERWDFALQLLHDQAHQGGTVSVRECREPGCTEFYRGA